MYTDLVLCYIEEPLKKVIKRLREGDKQEQESDERIGDKQEDTKHESDEHGGAKWPSLIFAFDEAHVLTEKRFDWAKPETMFSELQKALRSIGDLDVFSLFLSNTGDVSQFGGETVSDLSSRFRIHKKPLPPPFTNMGFDQFTRDALSKHKSPTLSQVSSIDTMVSFGRPL